MIKDNSRAVVARNISNIPGWRSKRKLVVLESDDWGSIRMPSKEVYNQILKSSDPLTDQGFLYNKYDSLATVKDLTALFEVLYSVKDSTGKSAILTPVSLVANPDFSRIKSIGFEKYYYEPFTETLSKYKDCENSFTLWREGIKEKLFIPQFHGREHLNVKAWLKALKKGHEKTLHMFNNEMWGFFSSANEPDIGIEFQAAFDFLDPEDLIFQKEVIINGLQLFESLFGYRASFFVPPNGPFSSKLEPVCFSEGIKYLSSSKIQIEPIASGKSRKRLHWIGQRNSSGLTFLTRNCFFEPVQPGQDWIDSCLKDISIAFRWHKPAVISSHRVNYIGALYPENRENGLRQLKLLLKRIMATWPDTEFLTTVELGKAINNE